VQVRDRRDGTVERGEGRQALRCCRAWTTWGERLDDVGGETGRRGGRDWTTWGGVVGRSGESVLYDFSRPVLEK
jgi:hypothetical protein